MYISAGVIRSVTFRRTCDTSQWVSVTQYVNIASPLTTGTPGAKKIFKYQAVCEKGNICSSNFYNAKQTLSYYNL